MEELIFNTLNVFFVVLEIILFIYILTVWLPIPKTFKEMFIQLLEPIFIPIRYLINHSIYKTQSIDMTPLIAFLVIIFLQGIFS